MELAQTEGEAQRPVHRQQREIAAEAAKERHVADQASHGLCAHRLINVKCVETGHVAAHRRDRSRFDRQRFAKKDWECQCAHRPDCGQPLLGHAQRGHQSLKVAEGQNALERVAVEARDGGRTGRLGC